MTPSGGFPVAPFFRHLHGQPRETSLPSALAPDSQPTAGPIHPGMEVLAGRERIGRVVEVVVRGAVRYLRVERYGLGHDELYLPTGMIEVIGRDFVSLHARPADLAASVWHELPSEGSDDLSRAA